MGLKGNQKDTRHEGYPGTIVGFVPYTLRAYNDVGPFAGDSQFHLVAIAHFADESILSVQQLSEFQLD